MNHKIFVIVYILVITLAFTAIMFNDLPEEEEWISSPTLERYRAWFEAGEWHVEQVDAEWVYADWVRGVD